MEAAAKLITVFGGSGFLGTRVVRALLAGGFRVRLAARHPQRAGKKLSKEPGLETIGADIQDEAAVARALEGAFAAVNAVSLYVEKGQATFESIHVEGAARLAHCAAQSGLEQLVHVSGLGISEDSPSAFVRARARGEQVVRAAFSDATIVRPSVMFACGDGFLAAIEQALMAPVVPLFGRGETRLQPAFVNDVAEAIARIIQGGEFRGQSLELGGGKVYRYKDAVAAVARHKGQRRWLIPMPFAIWRPVVGALALLPQPPLTRDQLILMESDNVAESGAPGFAALGIEAQSLESILPDC